MSWQATTPIARQFASVAIAHDYKLGEKYAKAQFTTFLTALLTRCLAHSDIGPHKGARNEVLRLNADWRASFGL
ncbi:MAG: hypothetical protein ACJAQW_000303 [Paracoccaceae bacterium]